MKIVHQTTNLADAYLLRDLLAQAGIQAHVQGEFLRGAVGELPADTPVSLMVPEAQALEARGIIADWERSRPEDEDVQEETGAAATAPASSGRGASTLQILGALSLGVLCGGAIVWAIHNRPGDGTARDYDGDGRIDERTYLAGERVDRIETDRNRDGRVDQIVRYRANGDAHSVELDEGFDGRFEIVHRYRDNQPMESSVDHNGDGAIDMRFVHESGVIVLEEDLDTNARVVRTIRYRGGVPVSGEFDADGDGKLDTARTYDTIGEIVASRPLGPATAD